MNYNIKKPEQKSMFTRLLLMLLLILTFIVSPGREEYDSIYRLIRSGNLTREDLSVAYAKLSFHHRFEPIDSAAFFSRKGLEIARKAGSCKGLIKNEFELAHYYYVNGQADSALLHLEAAASRFEG